MNPCQLNTFHFSDAIKAAKNKLLFHDGNSFNMMADDAREISEGIIPELDKAEPWHTDYKDQATDSDLLKLSMIHDLMLICYQYGKSRGKQEAVNTLTDLIWNKGVS